VLSVVVLSACVLGSFDKVSEDGFGEAPTSGGGTVGGSGSGGTSSGGTSSGGTSTDGTGGVETGGAGTGGSATRTYDMIDDMEDGDKRVLQGTGRDGWWYTTGDGSSPSAAISEEPISAIPGGRDGSLFSARALGQGFTVWAGFGLFFGQATDTNLLYDASAWTGISFWIRSGAGTLNTQIMVGDASSDDRGGICNLRQGTCYNAFSSFVTARNDWTYVELPFADLARHPYGLTETFDSSRVGGVYIGLPTNQSFDVWIDDLAFYR
jgi:hypothetical protein